MRIGLIVIVAMFLGAMSSFSHADTWPLADLEKTGKGKTDLGDWAVVAFAGRDDFPYLSERTELEEAESGRWTLPNRGAGEVKINATSVNIRSAGRQNKPEIDKWLAAVVIAPKPAGNYAVTGTMTGLWCDSDPNTKNSLKWAVLRGKADGKKFKVIASGEAGQGDTIDLASQEKLKSIVLEQGETIVVTLFRPGHWGAAGGDITALNVDKATATPEPTK